MNFLARIAINIIKLTRESYLIDEEYSQRLLLNIAKYYVQLIKIYICASFNSLILTQDNLALKVIRENLATIVMIKSFFAFRHSFERILD